MFGKKPSPPPAKPQAQAAGPQAPTPRPSGWAMMALLADYTVSGFLPPTEMPLLGFLNVPTQSTITLAGASLQPLQAQSAAAAASLAEATLPKSTLIALVPQDEAGMRSAAQQMPNRPARVVLYTGPYIIRGALMLPGDMPVRNAFSVGAGSMAAVTQAEVISALAGSRLAPLKAPLLIVNKPLVQLYHPE